MPIRFLQPRTDRDVISKRGEEFERRLVVIVCWELHRHDTLPSGQTSISRLTLPGYVISCDPKHAVRVEHGIGMISLVPDTLLLARRLWTNRACPAPQPQSLVEAKRKECKYPVTREKATALLCKRPMCNDKRGTIEMERLRLKKEKTKGKRP